MPAKQRIVLKPSCGAAAVITGAAHGIGRSFAYEVIRRGGDVLCVDNDTQALEKTVTELAQFSEGKVIAYPCDVGDEEQMSRLSDEAETKLQRPVTLLINNAGVAVAGKVGELSLEDWQWCIDVNLWGVIHGCHFFVPKLRALGYGGVINVASAAGFVAWPNMATYCATKAGVMALSETVAGELAGSGVNLSVLCPTAVDTDIVEHGRIPKNISKLIDKHIKDRWAFLASSDAVARQSLDALDKNQLYVLPQWDSRMLWRAKRWTPRAYAKAVGEVFRLSSV
jgi:short-subunit dehydrogenase